MKRNILLFDPAAAADTGGGGGGGPITQAIAAAQPAPQNISTVQPNTDNQSTMPEPNWNDSNVDIDMFRPGNRPLVSPEPLFEKEAREAKAKSTPNNNEQSTETGEEGKEKDEDKVQPNAETNEDGTPKQVATETETIVPTDKSVEQSTQQQQQRVNQQADPLLEAYPELNVFGKKMDKGAREWVTARLRDNLKYKSEIAERDEALALAQKGLTKIPDSYYENQHAYVLLPQYQESFRNATLANQVQQHWNRQYVNVLNGKDWQPCNIDNNGQLVVGAPQKYTEEGMAYVMQAKDFANNQYQKLAGEVENIQQNFSTTVQQRVAKINQATSELFPAETWDNEKTPQGKTAAAIRQSVIELGITPANPAFNLLVKAGAALILERQFNQAQQKKKETNESIQKDVRKAGPTGNNTVGGGGSSGKSNGDEVTIDMFKAKLPSNRYYS